MLHLIRFMVSGRFGEWGELLVYLVILHLIYQYMGG